MSSVEGNTALIQRELVTDTGLVPVSLRPDGWINITHIAKAAGKLVGGWTRLQDTQEYLEALALDMQISISKLLITVQGRGDAVEQGTWAHPEVAIDFAAWCHKKFKIQVNRWINELRTTGHVDLRQHSVNPIQNMITANQEAILHLDTQQQCLVMRVDFVEKRLVEVKYCLHNELDLLKKDLEERRLIARKRYQREAPQGHEQWWWDKSGKYCLNQRCRKLLDPLAPSNAHNYPNYDEVIPVVDGGKRTMANMQVICRECNVKKGKKWIDYAPPQLREEALRLDPSGKKYLDELKKKLQLAQQLGFSFPDEKEV